MKYTVEINFAFKKPLCIMRFSSFICLYLSLCPLSPLIFIQPMNPSINLYLSYYRGLSIAPWCNVPFETTCHAEGVDVAYCSFYQYFDGVPPIYQVSVNSKYCHVHTNNPVQGLVTDDSTMRNNCNGSGLRKISVYFLYRGILDKGVCCQSF